MLGPYFKSRSSFRQKYLSNDLIRYTWVRSTIPSIPEVIKLIPQNVRFDIDDHRAKISSYDGVHINLNYIYEIQLHTPESLAVRENEVHHRMYRLKRYKDSISQTYSESMRKKQFEIREDLMMNAPLPMNLPPSLPTAGHVNYMFEDLLEKLSRDFNEVKDIAC